MNIVILGGGYAGVMTALRLAGKTRRTGTQITLVSGSDHFVERIRLHQLATQQPMKQHPYTGLLKNTGIQFVQGWVEQLQPDQNQLRLHDGRTLPYDYLVYALGSTVSTAGVPGAAEYAHTVGSEALATRLQEALASLKKGRVVICGGGLTGIELSTEIAELYPHLNVMLLTRGDFGAQFSPKGQQHVWRVFRDLNIEVCDQMEIQQIRPQQVETAQGVVVPFDLCIWAGAFAPAPLAREAGLKVNAGGQILVDQFMRSVSHRNIYAVGDAASLENVLDVHIRMGCATALPMGAYAADHLTGIIQHKEVTAPYSFGYVLQCISLGRQEALIQWVHSDDSPRNLIFTGRFGAWFKEMVCQYAVRTLYWERRLPGFYFIPRNQAAIKAELRPATQKR